LVPCRYFSVFQFFHVAPRKCSQPESFSNCQVVEIPVLPIPCWGILRKLLGTQKIRRIPACHTGTVTQASGGILFVAWLERTWVPFWLVNLVGSGRQGNEHDYGTLVKQKWTRSELCFIFAVLCPSQHWGWNSQVGPTSIRCTFSGIG
jgi:hypothetical protein